MLKSGIADVVSPCSFGLIFHSNQFSSVSLTKFSFSQLSSVSLGPKKRALDVLSMFLR